MKRSVRYSRPLLSQRNRWRSPVTAVGDCLHMATCLYTYPLTGRTVYVRLAYMLSAKIQIIMMSSSSGTSVQAMCEHETRISFGDL